jgi:hypothetical protein
MLASLSQDTNPILRDPCGGRLLERQPDGAAGVD